MNRTQKKSRWAANSNKTAIFLTFRFLLIPWFACSPTSPFASHLPQWSSRWLGFTCQTDLGCTAFFPGSEQIPSSKRHPTVLAKDNLFISSDYIGELREEYFNLNQTPAIIINGECGDVSTRFTRQGDDFEETRRIGKGIARVLSEVKDFREITMDSLSISSFTLNIDKTIDPTVHLYEFDDIRFVTIPSEIVYNLGQLIRSQDGEPTFILAYANEYNGYAVDKEQYGKYFESSITNYLYGKADELIEGVLNLIKSKS